MHFRALAQTCWPVGHWQVPCPLQVWPSLGQVPQPHMLVAGLQMRPPPPQSPSRQQAPVGMHLAGATVHGVLPVGQPHLLVVVLQTWPATAVQSALSQQSAAGMHLPSPHFFCPGQHSPIGMHTPPLQSLRCRGQMHLRSMHWSMPGQTVVHELQCWRSLRRSTQRLAFAHQDRPLGQHSFRLVTHLLGMLVGPGQRWRPPGQPQVVVLQTRSPGQRLLQAPQWSRLLRTLMQAPLHTWLGDTQVHTRATQASAPAQALPQTPQFLALLSRFTHDWSQRVSASLQAITH
jgi:hypothetical protein